MPLDELILERIRESSRELWRDVRHRAGLRALPALLLAAGYGWAAFWLLGDTWNAGRPLPAAARIGLLLPPAAALLAACALAVLDSLHALLVSGPLLRSLGDLALSPPLRRAGPDLAAHFAAFASPQRLARAARVRDLPLVLFLAHVVLRVDVKALRPAVETGLGREALVRGVERQARQGAATVLLRLRRLLWVTAGSVFLLPFLVAWLLG